MAGQRVADRSASGLHVLIDHEIIQSIRRAFPEASGIECRTPGERAYILGVPSHGRHRRRP
jgi:hypothetical protein